MFENKMPAGVQGMLSEGGYWSGCPRARQKPGSLSGHETSAILHALDFKQDSKLIYILKAHSHCFHTIRTYLYTCPSH